LTRHRPVPEVSRLKFGVLVDRGHVRLNPPVAFGAEVTLPCAHFLANELWGFAEASVQRDRLGIIELHFVSWPSNSGRGQHGPIALASLLSNRRRR